MVISVLNQAVVYVTFFFFLQYISLSRSNISGNKLKRERFILRLTFRVKSLFIFFCISAIVNVVIIIYCYHYYYHYFNYFLLFVLSGKLYGRLKSFTSLSLSLNFYYYNHHLRLMN